MSEQPPGDFLDEYGQRLGYCNGCGEEAPAFSECCDDGEVVPYDDDPEADQW